MKFGQSRVRYPSGKAAFVGLGGYAVVKGRFTLGLEASCDICQHTENHFQGGIEEEEGNESLEKFTTSIERRKSCYNPFRR